MYHKVWQLFQPVSLSICQGALKQVPAAGKQLFACVAIGQYLSLYTCPRSRAFAQGGFPFSSALNGVLCASLVMLLLVIAVHGTCLETRLAYRKTVRCNEFHVTGSQALLLYLVAPSLLMGFVLYYFAYIFWNGFGHC